MIKFALKLFNFLRHIALDVLNRDRWFLILDPTTQEAPDTSWIEDTNQAGDSRARDYEKRNHEFTKALTLHEVWAILNPLSIFQFLRYSLSDVI